MANVNYITEFSFCTKIWTCGKMSIKIQNYIAILSIAMRCHFAYFKCNFIQLTLLLKLLV